MSEVSEGLATGAGESESLLDAFIDAGDFDDADYLKPEEATQDAAAAAEDADQPETEDEDTEGTEVEAKDAKEADAEDDGDYVELDNEDGTTERVALSELLAARNQLNELGPNVDQIRHTIAEQATAQVQERFTALDGQIAQTAELYATLNQLMPQVQPPSEELLDERSHYYNPGAYRQQMEAYNNVSSIMETARTEIQGLNQQYTAEATQKQEMQAQKDWAALTAIDSTWTKGDAAKRLTDLRGSISEIYGIQPELVGNITNPGFIRMAEDAKKYRDAMAKGVKPQSKSAPRLVKGGKGKGKPQGSAKKAKANAYLAKTGKVSNLEDVWGDFL